LELEERESAITQIKRVRVLGNNIFNYIINYVPIEIGSKLTEQQLYKKAFLQILEQDYGLLLTEAIQTIKASFADREVAEKLGILTGSPTLFVERVLYGQKRKPIELVQISYRGDLFKYVVKLKNVKTRKGNIWVHQPE
jgi:GntR family transcriptional regulator